MRVTRQTDDSKIVFEAHTRYDQLLLGRIMDLVSAEWPDAARYRDNNEEVIDTSRLQKDVKQGE